jgi:hypothetical protein
MILLAWCWEPDWGWKIIDLAKVSELNAMPLQTFATRSFPMDLAAKFISVTAAVSEIATRLAGRDGFGRTVASQLQKERNALRRKAG